MTDDNQIKEVVKERASCRFSFAAKLENGFSNCRTTPTLLRLSDSLFLSLPDSSNLSAGFPIRFSLLSIRPRRYILNRPHFSIAKFISLFRTQYPLDWMQVNSFIYVFYFRIKLIYMPFFKLMDCGFKCFFFWNFGW